MDGFVLVARRVDGGRLAVHLTQEQAEGLRWATSGEGSGVMKTYNLA